MKKHYSFSSAAVGPILLLALVESSPGRSDCPCLDLAAHGSAAEGCLAVTFDLGSNHSICGAGTPLCYPADYGLGSCQAWDWDLGPKCDGERSPWCARQWCFVNETVCRSSDTAYFKAGDGFPLGASQSCLGEELFFSFDTCGANTSFLETSISDRLRGKHLRVAFPALQNPLVMRTNHTDGDFIPAAGNNEFDVFRGDGPHFGMYIDMLGSIAENAGFTYSFQAVSGGSLAETSSQWTACARDVYKGLADLCVGRSWATAQRRAIAPFTSPISFDNMYLLVRMPQDNRDFWDIVTLVFTPFEPTLWLLIAAVTFAVGATYRVVLGFSKYGYEQWYEKEEEDGHTWPPRTWKQARKFVHREASHFLSSWFRSILEIMSGAVIYDVDSKDGRFQYQRSLPHKLIAFGYSVFIMITISAYTANLASILGNSNIDYDYHSIKECIDDLGCKMCSATSYNSGGINRRLQDSNPGMREVISKGSRKEASDAVASGECDVAIIGDFSYYIEDGTWSKKDDGECGVVLVGENLLSIDIAWPVAPDYARTVSFWAAKLGEDGTMLGHYNEWAPKYTCEPSVDTSEKTTLPATAFVGPVLFVSTMICASLVAFVCKQELPHLQERVTEVLRRSKAKHRHSSFNVQSTTTSFTKRASMVGPGVEMKALGATPARSLDGNIGGVSESDLLAGIRKIVRDELHKDRTQGAPPPAQVVKPQHQVGFEADSQFFSWSSSPNPLAGAVAKRASAHSDLDN
jgi:hypothetical protein